MVPKVSVVMAVYNLEDIVLETVHSVLQQSFSDFEFVIVDDGSTDSTVQRIEAVQDPRIKLIRAEHTGLPAAGLSRAYENSSADLVAVTGADDVWLPTKLERQVEFFARHPEVDVLHTAYHNLIDGQVNELPPRPEAEVSPAADILPRMIVSNFICTPTVMLRRSAVERAGGLFIVDPQLCVGEDFDLWLRLCETGVQFGYLREPLLWYRIRGSSMSRNRIRNWNCNLYALERAKTRQPELYKRHDRVVRNRLSETHRNIGRFKVIEGQPGWLADEWQAVKCSPMSYKPWGWILMGMCPRSLVRTLVEAREARSQQAEGSNR